MISYIKKSTDFACALAKHLCLIVLILLFTLSFGRYASAATVITDLANLLTAEETEQIRTYCDSILQRYETSVYIVTSDKIGSQNDFEGYMEQIGNADDAPEDMVLLFVSTKKNGHVYQIFGYGKAETYMTYDRCNKVMDRMQNDLKNKEYFSALETFCMQVLFYLDRHPRFDSFIFQAVPQLIFSLILSIVIVLLMAGNIAGKSTVSARNYIDNGHSRLLGHIDHFTHMTVHRVKKSSSSGGHSGGGGGGGRSHSSGSPHSF